MLRKKIGRKKNRVRENQEKKHEKKNRHRPDPEKRTKKNGVGPNVSFFDVVRIIF